jgi:hypothetical protein
MSPRIRSTARPQIHIDAEAEEVDRMIGAKERFQLAMTRP